MVMTRAQFESNLQSGFYNQVFNNLVDILKIFLTNDKTNGDTYRLNLLRANALINQYLASWDAAPTDSAKEAVEASVSYDLGSASFDPNSAVMWPGSGGLFGDVKSSGTTADNDPTSFSGTTGQIIKIGAAGEQVKNAAVNGKTIGNTLIFTTDSVKRFVPTGVYVNVVSVVGLSLVATLSVGTNSPNYNNICAAAILTGLDSNNETIQLPLTGNLNSVAPGSQVYARVSIGSTATTYDLNTAIAGFYI